MSYLPYALNAEWEQFTTIDWKKFPEGYWSYRKKDQRYDNQAEHADQ